MRCFNRSLCQLRRQTATRIIIMPRYPPPPHTPPYPHTLLERCDDVNKQVRHHASLYIRVRHCEAPDSIIIIQGVFIPVNIMKHFDTMGYTSLFRCQCHPYWRTRAGGGMCALGLGGRKDVVEKKIGGGDVNGTSWFMVLSCHRQACIRSFPFLCWVFFFFWGGFADAIMAASSAKSLQGLIQIN